MHATRIQESGGVGEGATGRTFPQTAEQIERDVLGILFDLAESVKYLTERVEDLERAAVAPSPPLPLTPSLFDNPDLHGAGSTRGALEAPECHNPGPAPADRFGLENATPSSHVKQEYATAGGGR